MRAVMVLMVMLLLGVGVAGCEKHIKEVRAWDKPVVAFTPAR
jgi:hypothetical protein